MSIELSPATEELIQAQLASRDYSNAAAVVEAALRLLDERRHRQKRLVEVRAMVAAGVAEADQGLLVDGEEMFNELERELDGMTGK